MQTRMLYCVTSDGTIVRAEAQISDKSAQRDATFAYPFQFPDILGRSLFSFIEGVEVRHIYEMLHERIFKDDRHVTFDYRCDSPDVRREMRMFICLDDHLVRYESVVLNETQRSVPLPLPSASVSAAIIPICSSCKMYRYPAGDKAWKEIDMILEESELPEHFNFSHTFCDRCYKALMDEIISN